MKISHLRWLLISSMLLFCLHALGQGTLTPPGPPNPSMKTLDQVESRTIVNAANTPGDSTNLFVINSPGSYYLTGNITGVSGKAGIRIQADNVTLDLNGFALLGVSGANTAIAVPGPHRNLHIRNGSVQGWGGGIACTAAIDSELDHLRVSQNGSIGITAGGGFILSEVVAESNLSGIVTGDGCTLTACYAANNTVDGFNLGSFCTMTASISSGNQNDGFHSGSNCTIIACTAVSNGSSGIVSQSNCAIKDCTVTGNSIHGIDVFGHGTRVDGNNVTDNGIGLNIDSSGFPGSGNLVIRNSLRGNTSPIFLSPNTMNGPFITIDEILTNSNPHANYLVP
jgi:parallel beta-helix repeat protein